MTNEDLIISLIQQDMRHNQLTGGLKCLGLHGDDFDLGILEIVAQLMEVPEGRTDDRWCAVYVSFMDEALHYEISGRGKTLKPLARLCYGQLKALLEYERRSALTADFHYS